MPGKRNGTKRRSPRKAAVAKRTKRARTDWARVDATTDAEIGEQIRRNPDDVEFTDEMLAAARWVMPEKKVPISFRVDPDVLEFFKSDGDGYQSRMNAVLRGYMRGRRGKAGKRRVG
jgi:uncharacterized protein (DUF4415 family)